LTIRKISSATILAAAISVANITPSFALGGSDPIPGIDVIIKKDPTLEKDYKPLSFGGPSMKKLNRLQFKQRPTFLMQLIADKVKVDRGFVQNGAKALSKWYCKECKNREQIRYKFRAGKTIYSIIMKRKH